MVRRPGIEPGSTAWKAAMLTTIPPTRWSIVYLTILLSWTTLRLFQDHGLWTANITGIQNLERNYQVKAGHHGRNLIFLIAINFSLIFQ